MLEEAERQNSNINPGQQVEYVLGDNVAKEIGAALTKIKREGPIVESVYFNPEEQKVDGGVNSKRTTLSNFGQYSDQLNGNMSQNNSKNLKTQNNIDPLNSSENCQLIRINPQNGNGDARFGLRIDQESQRARLVYVPQQQESKTQSYPDGNVWNPNSLDLNKDRNLN